MSFKHERVESNSYLFVIASEAKLSRNDGVIKGIAP